MPIKLKSAPQASARRMRTRRCNRSTLHQHHSHAWRWMPCSRPIPAIPARRWRWRPWSTRFGRSSCASIRTIRSGQTAIASFCPTAMLRCCSTRLLHLTGVKAVNAKYERLDEPAVTLDDIKRFRQIGSKCPGHPEYHLTSGVETTTGPLGQGCGNSVGMAIAGRWLAQHFNRPDFTMFDYDVYVVCGDGDMMEGVSSEAASLAGHQMLGNLCWIYDSNRITIEGHTDLAFSDDVAARFLAYGWNVQRVGDANDTERLAQAIEIFRHTDGRADPDHRRKPYRLWRTAQARHQRRPRRAARRGGDTSRQAQLRLAGGRQVPGAGRRARAFPGRHRPARPKPPQDLEHAVRILPEQVSRTRRSARAHAEARASRGLGRGTAGLPCRREGPCHARLLRQGAERHCLALPLADRRLGRSRAIDQDAPHVRGRRRSGSRHPGRPQSAFRRPRACHGRDPERAGAVQDPALRLGLPDLLRLHEAADPAEPR